jgi:hypothetical protein
VRLSSQDGTALGADRKLTIDGYTQITDGEGL